MKKNVSRRMFLRGAGGFTLAMPFLPSLLPRDAHAQSMFPKRFVAMATHHGGIWTPNMFPAFESLNQSLDYGGHTVRSGPLQVSV